MTPVCGDGIEASGSTRRILPARRGRRYRELEEDSESGVDRAAALEQLDGEVEVDVLTGGELGRLERLVAGAPELRGPPAFDALGLGLDLEFEFSC